jgi:hypothetical protein
VAAPPGGPAYHTAYHGGHTGYLQPQPPRRPRPDLRLPDAPMFASHQPDPQPSQQQPPPHLHAQQQQQVPQPVNPFAPQQPPQPHVQPQSGGTSFLDAPSREPTPPPAPPWPFNQPSWANAGQSAPFQAHDTGSDVAPPERSLTPPAALSSAQQAHYGHRISGSVDAATAQAGGGHAVSRDCSAMQLRQTTGGNPFAHVGASSSKTEPFVFQQMHQYDRR